MDKQTKELAKQLVARKGELYEKFIEGKEEAEIRLMVLGAEARLNGESIIDEDEIFVIRF